MSPVPLLKRSATCALVASRRFFLESSHAVPVPASFFPTIKMEGEAVRTVCVSCVTASGAGLLQIGSDFDSGVRSSDLARSSECPLGAALLGVGGGGLCAA